MDKNSLYCIVYLNYQRLYVYLIKMEPFKMAKKEMNE